MQYFSVENPVICTQTRTFSCYGSLLRQLHITSMTAVRHPAQPKAWLFYWMKNHTRSLWCPFHCAVVRTSQVLLLVMPVMLENIRAVMFCFVFFSSGNTIFFSTFECLVLSAPFQSPNRQCCGIFFLCFWSILFADVVWWLWVCSQRAFILGQGSSHMLTDSHSDPST